MSLSPLSSCFASVDFCAIKRRLQGFLVDCFHAADAVMIALTSSSGPQPARFHSLDSEPPSPIDPCASASSASHLPVSTPTFTPPATFSRSVPEDSPAPATPSSMLTVASPSAPNPPAHAVQDPDPAKGARRPKLSLQTSCVPVTFGKSTTGLALDISAHHSSSPTGRNTFSNAYDGFRDTAPVAPSPSSSKGSGKPLCSVSPFVGSKNGGHGEDAPPYQLPLGVKSILRNSPIPSSLSRSSLSAPAGNGRRRLFPAPKRVNYRLPIEEEISTVRFVAKHSDLVSSENSDEESSDASTQSASDSEEEEEEEEEEGSDTSASGSLSGSCISDEEILTTTTATTNNDDAKAANRETTLRKKKRKYQRSERQILAAGIRDGLTTPTDSETPRTPIQRRKKRPRHWRWTLGPIKDGYVQPASPMAPAPSGFSPPTPPDCLNPSLPTPIEKPSMTTSESKSDNLFGHHDAAPPPSRAVQTW